MTEPESDDKDQLWSEATFWFARMRSPDAEEFRSEFERWLARGALHRRYYNRASEHWMHGTAAFAEERARLHGDRNDQPQPSSRSRRKRGTVAALMAACVLIAGTTILLGVDRDAGPGEAPASSNAPATTRFATASGEQRRVQLVDGSVALLGGNTILRVRLGTAMRRIELDRGNARFSVAHEARPFVVFAGGGSVTAHGTVFEVRVLTGRRVSVHLIQGSVEVRLPPSRGAFQPPARRLRPGESISFAALPVGQSARAAASLSAPVDGQATVPLSVQAPLTGSRDYRNVRLAEIVADANRKAAVPIRLADAATGERRISGRFRIDDTALLAERLAALFDLAVDRRDPSAIELRPK